MSSAYDWEECAAKMFEAPMHDWATPGEMAQATNPNTVQTMGGHRDCTRRLLARNQR